MCEPTTIGLLVSAAGVGVSAVSQYQGVQAQNRANEYNAQMLNRNAEISKRQAEQAEIRGKEEETRHRQQVAQLKARQRTAAAGSGVLVDSGSGLDLLEDTAEFAEYDALSIRHNAALEAYGHQVQAGNYQGQAGLVRASNRSPGAAAGASLLTGGSNLIGQYYRNR